MRYLHAGGIDRPLAILKEAVGTVVPHQNWRGMFAWGSWGSGSQVGQRSDCMTSTQTNCHVLHWPGYQTSAYHADGNPGDQEYWLGSLVDGQRDASGQIYMRNRYYDPATGQFTQTDPIGLAGGLNAYGFANGDPVSFSDPYGLAADTIHAVDAAADSVLSGMAILALLGLQSDDPNVVDAAQDVITLLNDLHGSTENIYFGINSNEGRSGTGLMNDGSGVGSLVNPDQSTKRPITVRGAHELGHAWAIIFLGASDGGNSNHRRTQNIQSLRFENAMRTIYGCTLRRVHGTDSRYQNPACRFQ